MCFCLISAVLGKMAIRVIKRQNKLQLCKTIETTFSAIAGALVKV